MSLDPAEVAKIKLEIVARRDGVISPRDKAVFYTTGANEQAVAYAREHCSVTLEGVRDPAHLIGNEQLGEYGTPFGMELERRGYFRPTTGNIGEEDAEQQLDYADAVFLSASREYAEHASGEVEVFIGPPPATINGIEYKEEPFIHVDSAFARREREALIRNPQVTMINGQNRKDLCKILDTEKPLQKALEKIDAQLIDGHLCRDKRLLAKEERKNTPYAQKNSGKKSTDMDKSKSR